MPPQNSELAAGCAGSFRPYLDALCLANGYRFFAPEPGPSHLVRYEITHDDGTLETGEFPESAAARAAIALPSLLHAQRIHQYDRQSQRSARTSRGTRQGIRRAPGRRARRAKAVKLYLRRHYVPRTSEVRQGMRLSDKALYEERPLAELHARRAMTAIAALRARMGRRRRAGLEPLLVSTGRSGHARTDSHLHRRDAASTRTWCGASTWARSSARMAGSRAKPSRSLQQGTYSWSYLWWFEDSPPALWTVHIAALVVFALLTVGLFSRVVSVLALVAALAYVGRVPGALFGLDQINVMLAMYLAVGPCGDAFSLDRWLKRRRAGGPLPIRSSWSANLAIRLIQVHLCIIYWFAGTAKLTGPAWWDGTALWMALGNMEYQSLDMTWLADWPRSINLMTHVTVYWEILYCALIWPRLTRPVMLLLAIPLHMGIAICLGMVTFGLVMLIANLAFVPPEFVRSVARSRGGAGQGRGLAPAFKGRTDIQCLSVGECGRQARSAKCLRHSAWRWLTAHVDPLIRGVTPVVTRSGRSDCTHSRKQR